MLKFSKFSVSLFVILGMLVSCSGNMSESKESLPSSTKAELTSEQIYQSVDDGYKYTLKTYELNRNTKGIKILGERNLSSDSQINCDWTCSGIEFNVDTCGGDIEFTVSADRDCYWRAYVDGQEWFSLGDNVYFWVAPTRNKIVLKNVPEGEHKIRIIKVTGYTLALSAVLDVKLEGIIKEEAPEDKATYIEFIGDSISCGWGTIGNHAGIFADQDGTLAYPYKIAENVNADYSITALSGQGMLVGNPGVPKGYLYGSAHRDTATQYSFQRKADLVVINIGTNDFNNANVTEASFMEAYKAFLQTVKQKNGSDCKILCLYNSMNDTYADAIKTVCEELGGVSSGIWHYQLLRAVGNNHPSTAEHVGYTAVLTDMIRYILNS